MIANSLPDVYSMVYGWFIYGRVWDLIDNSGLYTIPIIILVIKEAIAARNSGVDEGNPGFLAVKRAETGVLSIVFVILFACMPVKMNGFEVSISSMSYENNINECVPKDGAVDIINDSIKNAFVEVQGKQLYIPLIWGLMHSFSSGTVSSLVASLPCSNDISFEMLQLEKSNIKDHVLKGDIERFYSDCYRDAKYRYFHNNPNGTDDVSWIGSDYLSSIDYYGSIKIGPLEGWLKDESFSDTQRPDLIYRSCSDYWNDPQKGLKERILKTIEPSLYEKFMTSLYSVFGIDENATSEEKKNELVKVVFGATAIDNEKLLEMGVEGSSSFSPFAIVRNVLLFKKTIEASSELVIFRSSANYILAIAQMVLIISIPMILLLSGFSIKALALTCVGFFALEFVNFIWAFGYWLNNVFLSYFWEDAASGTDQNQAMIIAIVGYTSYIAMPIAWLTVLGWSGFNVINGYRPTHQPSESSAKSVGSNVSNVAVGGVKKLAGRAPKLTVKSKS